MSKYKIYNLTPDGWGYLLQYRDGKIYDGYGNLVNLSFGVGTGKDGPQVLLGLRGFRGDKGRLDLKVFKDSKEIKVLLDHKDSKEVRDRLDQEYL